MSLPSGLTERIRDLEKEAYQLLREGKYKDAEEIYRKVLQIISEEQKKTKERIHKGAPLHMIGYSLLLQRKPADALEYFLLAHIEDLINTTPEEEAYNSPAAQALIRIFFISQRSLGRIKEITVREKGKRQILDPMEILEEFEKTENIRRKDLLSLCATVPALILKKYSISRIPGEYENRVFIGGNYDNIAVLKEIAKRTQALGYQPVIALDFDVPPEQIHHYDLILLHNCKYAVFEVTFPDGHLMEIERAREYGVQVLAVFQVRDETRTPPPTISSMLLTLNVDKYGYLDFDDLAIKISKVLPRRR